MVWIIVAIVAVVVIVALLALWAVPRRRSARLQHRFGPEYDRTVRETGDRREAESELSERFTRRQSFDVQPLDRDRRELYAQRWEQAQRDFVDQPAVAIGEADGLVIEVMRERGYPVSDGFEQRAADVSVDHPEVVEHYRAAHALSETATAGQASTEELRKAMVHFRALFDDLLSHDERRPTKART
jgi:FtsZ-interacting cell division protein ZipA